MKGKKITFVLDIGSLEFFFFFFFASIFWGKKDRGDPPLAVCVPRVSFPLPRTTKKK